MKRATAASCVLWHRNTLRHRSPQHAHQAHVVASTLIRPPSCCHNHDNTSSSSSNSNRSNTVLLPVCHASCQRPDTPPQHACITPGTPPLREDPWQCVPTFHFRDRAARPCTSLWVGGCIPQCATQLQAMTGSLLTREQVMAAHCLWRLTASARPQQTHSIGLRGTQLKTLGSNTRAATDAGAMEAACTRQRRPRTATCGVSTGGCHLPYAVTKADSHRTMQGGPSNIMGVEARGDMGCTVTSKQAELCGAHESATAHID